MAHLQVSSAPERSGDGELTAIGSSRIKLSAARVRLDPRVGTTLFFESPTEGLRGLGTEVAVTDGEVAVSKMV